MTTSRSDGGRVRVRFGIILSRSKTPASPGPGSKVETTDGVGGAGFWGLLLLQLECCGCCTSATHWHPIQ